MKHTIFWTIVLGTEILAYMAIWNKGMFWVITSCNFLIALVSFYLCRFIGWRFCAKIQQGIPKSLMSYAESWYVIAISALFIGIRLVTDLMVFNSGGANVFTYALFLMRIAISFTIPGFLFGIVEMYKKIVNYLQDRKTELESSVETLKIQVVHIESIKETKQKEVTALNELSDAQAFKIEMQARDIAAQEMRLAELDEKINEQHKKQTEMESSMLYLSEMNRFYKRDKEVTDEMYFRTNRDWQAQVKRYQRILAFYKIPDDDGLLPGLN